ncbi:MAG: group II truncated hemoglobin [Gammaproteobacteria bacterium]|nr:group II truncated hemoglobin [Gammaproteobacteria bacterium]MYD75254.1 group II truncated hemoglobin [Gammaproteobacteria bacterium]MYJ52726.1 group II truncated hemoglobin [Gammaproteobacteria bacterium]
MQRESEQYGVQDASYRAAGGVEGIRKLVDCFFRHMDTLPEARRIREMHPEDLAESRDKLMRFLCGWLGGPKLYQEKYGPISIPRVHRHLDIAESERDAWLKCMQGALDEQSYRPAFKHYLIRQLAIPAERVRAVCTERIRDDAQGGPGDTAR